MMNKILYAILVPYTFCVKCGCYDLKSLSMKIFTWKTWTPCLRLVGIKLLYNYSCNKNANKQYTDSVSWQSYAYLSAKCFHNSTSISDGWYMLKHHCEQTKALLTKYHFMISEEIFNWKLQNKIFNLIATSNFGYKIKGSRTIYILYILLSTIDVTINYYIYFYLMFLTCFMVFNMLHGIWKNFMETNPRNFKSQPLLILKVSVYHKEVNFSGNSKGIVV